MQFLSTGVCMKKFTLIELMVVIAIMGILMSILMPSLSQSRQKVRQSVCLSNLKQIGLSIYIYSSEDDNILPGPVYSLAKGEYKSGDQTLNSLLAPFASFPSPTNISYDELHVNKLFLCPSFTSSVANSTAKETIQFATFGRDADTNKRYFGYPSTGDAPMQVTAVDKPEKSVALKEIDNYYWPGSYGGAVSSNIRHGFKGGQAARSALYFDGHAAIKYEAATP